jgi:ribosome-associated heat shock protein Hsp15
MRDMAEVPERLRVDKWLWASRLVKTRQLAADAVKGGRVAVNGQAVKPSKEVGPGDRLQLTVGPTRRTVVIRAVALRRGPAAEAQQLYEETPESLDARRRQAEERRMAPPPVTARGGRPTKRDRRRLDSARRGRRGPSV